MSKFKMGDKVRLKAYVQGWSDSLKGKVFVVSDNKINGISSETVLNCVIEYPDDFELVEATPAPHVHHDMIVEWAKNPTRIVQFYDDEYYDYGWKDVVGEPPMWHTDKQYRFKPVEPERVFPKTSLGIKELVSHVISEHETVSLASLEAIANAAIKQYILEMEKA